MSKRLWLLPVLAVVLVAAGSGAAFAFPSLDGPTGIVSVPNAMVAPMGELQGALSYQKMTTRAIGMYGTDDFNDWSLQVLGGVANGAELWAAYSKANDELDTKAWGIGGKFQFAMEPTEFATLAVGGSFQKGSGDTRIEQALGMYTDVDIDTDATKLYLVATKDFTPAGLTTEWAAGTKILGTAGLLYEKVKRDVTLRGALTGLGSTDDSLTRPFLGVEFVAAGGTTLGLEYRWKDSDLDAKAVFSAMLRHQFDYGIVGEIGTTNTDQFGLGLDDQNFFARVGYTWTMGARK